MSQRVNVSSEVAGFNVTAKFFHFTFTNSPPGLQSRTFLLARVFNVGNTFYPAPSQQAFAFYHCNPKLIQPRKMFVIKNIRYVPLEFQVTEFKKFSILENYGLVQLVGWTNKTQPYITIEVDGMKS